MAVELLDSEFAELVEQALDSLPPDLASAIDNVGIVVSAESPRGQPELLGLYEGIPLPKRGNNYVGAMPDRISIFRGPLLRMCHSRDEVVEQVRITVIHELGHYFGFDDDQLHDRGYG